MSAAKPDAGEWAEKLSGATQVSLYPDSPNGEMDRGTVEHVLAKFQRETILWLAMKVPKKPGLHQPGDCECPRCVLETVAESCGRGK